METNESGSRARFPDILNEEALRALVANARVPHSASPAQSEEERQRTQEREQALLASMMGYENASLPQSNVVSPVISAAFAKQIRNHQTIPVLKTGIRSFGARNGGC